MKVIYNCSVDADNWTKGKEYEAKPSFIQGFVSIIDDTGAEQLIRIGSTLFTWQ